MSACNQEMCTNWTGSGCICEVMDLERENETEERYAEDIDWRQSWERHD